MNIFKQMIPEKIRVVFTIPDLRRKILITLLFLAVYRIGWQVPLPILDQAEMSKWFSSQQGTAIGKMLDQVAVFSASQLSQATIFGLGIMPYISASIIFQLLGSVYPPLERLQKEGESGRKKINEYTRYATVVLCLGQSFVYVKFLADSGLARKDLLTPDGGLPWHLYFVSVITMTCGTVFLMWVGEQIDEYGIGNGISLLIMAGILSGMPGAGFELLKQGRLELGAATGLGVDKLMILALLFVAVIVGVVLITQGQRRIPTQSAKHVRGRRVYGGGRQYLPLRVNQAGVMPIIFASSLLMFPSVLLTMIMGLMDQPPNWLQVVADSFRGGTSFLYNVMYIVLIYFFCYFWTAITFNPKDMANNLKDYGSFIPGYRPGKRTADYLERVMVRITYVGAGFLAVVAIIPTVVAGSLGISYQVASFYGGTGLLIAVSVAFDLVQKIDSHLVMRNYRGLLERG